MIKVITNKDSLIEFSSSWGVLYEGCPYSTPFQKFEYIVHSIDFSLGKDDQIYIIAVKMPQANKWVAVFPLYIDAKKTLRFINARHSDFCAPLILPQYDHYNLFVEVSDYIKHDGRIKAIVFENLTVDNPLVGMLKSEFKYIITYDFNDYSTVSIAKASGDVDSVDAFRGVPSKRRGKLRKIKREKNTNCVFEIFSKSHGQVYPQKYIDDLVDHMISSNMRAREYLSDIMLAFWEKLYESGVVDVAILYQNDVVVACSFLLVDEKKREYIEWIILYRDKSWNVSICLQIEEYLYSNEENSIFNFARGIYDYKLVNFHPDVKPLFRVMIAKTKWGHFKNIMATAIHYFKPIVKSWLGR